MLSRAVTVFTTLVYLSIRCASREVMMMMMMTSVSTFFCVSSLNGREGRGKCSAMKI